MAWRDLFRFLLVFTIGTVIMAIIGGRMPTADEMNFGAIVTAMCVVLMAIREGRPDEG